MIPAPSSSRCPVAYAPTCQGAWSPWLPTFPQKLRAISKLARGWVEQNKAGAGRREGSRVRLGPSGKPAVYRAPRQSGVIEWN